MAISRTRRPRVLVQGAATNVREKRTKDKTRIYAYEVTIDQEDGGLLAVDVFMNEETDVSGVPTVGEFVALWASVSESAQFGASLTYEGTVSEDDLDKLHSNLKALA